MDRLNSNEFWLQVSGELGVELPDLIPEPKHEPTSVIEHPEEEQVWNSKYFKTPPFRLRRCQIEGTNYWKQNQDGCLLEHATGSGKTLSGLMIASNMFEFSDFVIIACPLRDIALQWEEAAGANFKDNVSINIIDSDHPDVKLGGITSSIKRNEYSKAILIYVNNSLANEEEWANLKMAKITKSFSLILDEAHKWGSENKLNFLEDNIIDKKICMLSLTAKLHKGLSGNKRQYKLLEGSRQPHIFGLFEAIKVGLNGSTDPILKPYNYHIHLVEIDLSEDVQAIKDRLKVEAITKSIDLISDNRGIPTIVYVKAADSDPIYGANAVAGRISDTGVNCLDYVGSSSAEMKKKRRELFNAGDIEVLVAVRCLDEGVNIPRIQRLMLTHGSLDDERQWIQRRGRALRIDPEFPETPEIHDFLPVPSDLETEDFTQASLDLIKNHYVKVKELADLSEHSFGLKEYKLIMEEIKHW